MARLYIQDLEQFQELSRAEKRQVTGGKSVVPLAGGDRRSKITDFNNPFPRDRVSNDDGLYDAEINVHFAIFFNDTFQSLIHFFGGKI